MSSWKAPEYARAVQGAEAQMRRAESFWESARAVRRRVVLLVLMERGRRFWLQEEFRRNDGPRAPALRSLERAADSAHDRRLFEIENMRTMARKARAAEMQAKILYEESEGR